MIRVSAFLCLLFSTYPMIGFFLPSYLQGKSLDAVEIGIVMACGSLVSVVGQPFWGFVSDQRKTVKRVLALLLCGNALAITGFFAMESFLALAVFFTVFMFFNGATGPLTETLVVSYAHEHRVEYGKIRLWGEVGVGLSALLLGVFIERYGSDAMWMLYAALLGLAFLTLSRLQDSRSTPVPVDVRALGRLFVQPRLLWFLVLVLMISTPHRMNDLLLALYLSELGAPETMLGLAWVVATFSTIPALLLVGRIMKRWNELLVIVFAAVAYTVRWAIYAMTNEPAVLVAAQALHSVTFPLFLVAAIRHLGVIVPSELRASGQAAFAVTFGGLGGMLGSAAGGYALERLGAAWTYGIGGGFAFIAAAATLLTYFASRMKAGAVQEQGVSAGK
ncbi:MFS transporter [Paenibacillus sp. TRM 82003]|nr:MFS transporter [Paenibacillus sp. TRM 82003]